MQIGFFERNRHVTDYLFAQTGLDRPQELFKQLGASRKKGDLAERARAKLKELKTADTARVAAVEASAEKPVATVLQHAAYVGAVAAEAAERQLTGVPRTPPPTSW